MSPSPVIRLAAFALVLAASDATSNPVAKVIKLLEDLKKEVVGDGTKEATAYGKYACFCKDTTKKKSTAITKGEDKINTLSASIVDNTASKEEKEAEVVERKENHKQLGEDLQTTVARCSTSQAEYEAGKADMAKAIESLNKAIKAMSAQKKSIGLAASHSKKGKTEAKSFIELDQDVQRALLFAKVDPNDPAYKYHSKEINEILAKLLKDFKDEKQDGEDKWTKTSEACGKEKNGLNKKMKSNLDAIKAAKQKIQDLKKRIAKDRGDLVESQDTLEEDAKYLKDLTAQCEEKATDFDQRASMRNDEITALTQAIKIISNKVEGADKSVNRFLQTSPKVMVATPLSFLQAAPFKAVTNFLARVDASSSEQAMRQRVVSLLRLQGSKLGSAELSMMAMQIKAVDHFKEVKNIIQSLIEKLLDEAKAEASKKGFCDTEIAKAELDREHEQAQATDISTDLKELESKKEDLEAELKQLKKDIAKTEKALKEALTLRKKEKSDNEDTLKTANDGLDALNEAILILRAFYKDADKRLGVLLQGPVDDDTSGPGFSGDYKGKQKSSRAIFELLGTIVGDFEATIKKTEQSEADSAADFVKFDRSSKEEIASKETKTKMDKQDLKSTNTNIEKNLDDLKTTMGLQHDANKMIESLKPACLDAGGMNFGERTTKRKEEIAALNVALCILTPGKKDGDCK